MSIVFLSFCLPLSFYQMKRFTHIHSVAFFLPTFVILSNETIYPYPQCCFLFAYFFFRERKSRLAPELYHFGSLGEYVGRVIVQLCAVYSEYKHKAVGGCGK